MHNLTHQGAATLLIGSDISLTGRVIQAAGDIDLNSKKISGELFVLEGGRILDSGLNGEITSTLPFELRNGEVSVPLKGSAGFNKITSGTVVLNAANTLSGKAIIDEGVLKFGSQAGLENVSEVTVNSLGLLDLNSHSVSLSMLAGVGRVALGRGDLTLIATVDGGFGGVIDGSGGLLKKGLGTFFLSGPSTYQGVTRIEQGTLKLVGSKAISDASNIMTAGEGTFDVGASQQTIQSIEGLGTLRMSGGTLLIAHADQPVLFDGAIQGFGAIAKEGPARLSFNGTGDFLGTIDVRSGAIQANGRFANAAAIVHDGASLQGTGTLGDLTVNSGGIVRPGNSPGMLTVNNLDLKADSMIVFEIGGPMSGSQHDQISATNHAILNGQIVVQLVDGYVPMNGEGHDLIRYASFSGSPALNFSAVDVAFTLRQEQLPNAYRIVSVITSAPPPVPPGCDDCPTQPKPPETTPVTPSSALPAATNDEELIGETTILVSTSAVVSILPNNDARDWFQQSPGILPTAQIETDAGIAIEAVVDAIFAEESLADLSSFISDIRPYAAVDLDPAKLISSSRPRKSPDSPNQEDTPIPYLPIAAGTVFVVGGFTLLISTFFRQSQKSRRERKLKTIPLVPTTSNNKGELNSDIEEEVSPAYLRRIGTGGIDHDQYS